MPTLAFLPKASSNRVYGDAAPALLAAELAVVAGLGGEVHRLGGVDYVVAEAAGDLDAGRVALLSNLSGVHAVFERRDELLRPLDVDPVRRQDDDVTTIQRYQGKTNESFTHLLVNLALAAGDGGFGRLQEDRPLRLLDPACGRGTTLNRGIVYGMDAVGLDHDQRDLEAYGTFLLGWLKDKRLKHDVERSTLRKGRPTAAHRFAVTYGAGKDRRGHRKVELVHDDTVRLRDHVTARSIDLLACDLPYGVQHGSTAAGGDLRRSPGDLLAEALPVWRDALRPGAGIALAWNLRTLPRARAVERLAEAGYELAVPADDDRFSHRVDRAIQRDVVVARRPGP
jgi:SAM-dependent methyltransferase